METTSQMEGMKDIVAREVDDFVERQVNEHVDSMTVDLIWDQVSDQVWIQTVGLTISHFWGKTFIQEKINDYVAHTRTGSFVSRLP
jgi:hypothetical protein